MLLSERDRDRKIRDKQRRDTKTIASLYKILKALYEIQVGGAESDVARSICPHDGCLLFPSDETCPACRVRLSS